MTDKEHEALGIADYTAKCGAEDFDWITVEAAIDGRDSDDAVEQARREGAHLGIFKVLDLIIFKKHTGLEHQQLCRNVGTRALILAVIMGHPSVEGSENVQKLAESIGVSAPTSIPRTARFIRKKIGIKKA